MTTDTKGREEWELAREVYSMLTRLGLEEMSADALAWLDRQCQPPESRAAAQPAFVKLPNDARHILAKNREALFLDAEAQPAQEPKRKCTWGDAFGGCQGHPDDCGCAAPPSGAYLDRGREEPN